MQELYMILENGCFLRKTLNAYLSVYMEFKMTQMTFTQKWNSNNSTK